MLVFFYGQPVSLVLWVQLKARLGLAELPYLVFRDNTILLFSGLGLTTSVVFWGTALTLLKKKKSLDLIVLERKLIKTV